MDGPPPSPRDPHNLAPLAMIANASVAIDGDTVIAIGNSQEIAKHVTLREGGMSIDATGCVVAPGLLDSHTHALFVGQRSDEFVARIEGATYAEIAARGGGIARSVRDLRASDEETLSSTLQARLARMREYGVTCVEVKTGYGLDTASELGALNAIARVRKQGRSRVVSTFLGLHAVDPVLRSLADGRARFIERTFNETWPAVYAQARPDFIDAYVDSTGFSLAECRPLLERARTQGVRARLHVGQFADIGGAQLAAELGAASADHLEHLSDIGLAAMAGASVVAGLLPGAAFSLGQPMPDARRIRNAGVEVALATDCNPGTSYIENLPLMAAFAVRQMGLSTVEAWWAMTRAPARALERFALGRVAVGLPADLAVFVIPTFTALPYAVGSVRAKATVVRGVAEQYATHA